MSYIKAYHPEIAKLAGIQAASLLNHIKFWMDTKDTNKIWRTNKQLSEDFQGSLSESQIQRAKKKLVDLGLITISHDKGHLRTTHFMLTEKAKSLMGAVKEAVAKVAKTAKKYVKKATGQMAESFKEGFENKKKVKGFSLTDAINKANKEKKVEVPVQLDVEVEEEMEVDYDEHFAALDIALEECHKRNQQEKQLSLTELMAGAFNQIPNIDILEKNRQTLEMANHFNEDY